MSIQTVDTVVRANGIRLHYRRWLPTKADQRLPSLVLLHGLASAASIWELVAPLLAERGYVMTAFDQRGHGESDKPDSGYDFATIVADDAAAMEALDLKRSIIIGHSWGASVALQYATTHAGQVQSLILVDGATSQLSLRPNWSLEQALIDLAPPRYEGTPREDFLAYYRKGPLGQQWTPQLEDIILHIVQVRADDTVAPRLAFENHLQIIRAMWDQPTFDLYRQADCPITLIVAEPSATDEFQEEFLRRKQQGIVQIQAARPDVTVVRMPDTIHDIPLQRPRELAEAILRAVAAQV